MFEQDYAIDNDIVLDYVIISKLAYSYIFWELN